MQCRECGAEITFVDVWNKNNEVKRHPINLPGVMGVIKVNDQYVFSHVYSSHMKTCPTRRKYQNAAEDRDPTAPQRRERWGNEVAPTDARPVNAGEADSEETKKLDHALMKRVTRYWEAGVLNEWESNFTADCIKALKRFGTLTARKRAIFKRILREAPDRAVPEHTGYSDEEDADADPNGYDSTEPIIDDGTDFDFGSQEPNF